MRDPLIIASASADRGPARWTVGTPLAVRLWSTCCFHDLDAGRPRAVAGDEIVYVETTHPTDPGVLYVTWVLDGVCRPEPGEHPELRPRRALSLAPGTHTLTATVTDPASPSGPSETRMWAIDNTPADGAAVAPPSR